MIAWTTAIVTAIQCCNPFPLVSWRWQRICGHTPCAYRELSSGISKSRLQSAGQMSRGSRDQFDVLKTICRSGSRKHEPFRSRSKSPLSVVGSVADEKAHTITLSTSLVQSQRDQRVTNALPDQLGRYRKRSQQESHSMMYLHRPETKIANQSRFFQNCAEAQKRQRFLVAPQEVCYQALCAIASEDPIQQSFPLQHVFCIFAPQP